MSYKSGLKDCANMGAATSLAQKAQSAPAGAFNGGMPPKGPEAEPVRINGVPTIGGKGVSGKGAK